MYGMQAAWGRVAEGTQVQTSSSSIHTRLWATLLKPVIDAPVYPERVDCEALDR